jgi:formate-dependent nitrite reductase membrane component NrfD
MFFLWIDLARRWNAWRFYATLEVTSPMSWGSWILLFTMILLFLRMWTHVPMPTAVTTKNIFARTARWVWRLVARVGEWIAQWNRVWDVLALILGAALGLYTGVLLNTIPARPLWNSSILPLLFLASGLASGCAFLCLFIPGKQVHKLAPVALVIAGIEVALILSYILTLTTGTEAMQRASGLLLSGSYALAFWVLVVGVGVLVPALIESVETTQRRVPAVVVRFAPILTLMGGVALRFVIVYAGLESFI